MFDSQHSTNGDGSGEKKREKQPLNEQKKDNKQLKDPEEYVQRRRLEDIFDARTAVANKKLEAREYAHLYEDWFTATSMFRGSVENYLSEIQSLADEYDEMAQWYWEEVRLGELQLTLPLAKDTTAFGGERYILQSKGKEETIKNPPEPGKIPFNGLASILGAPDPITRTYELETTHPVTGGGTITHTVEEQINWETLENARRIANKFVADIGLEADPEDDGGEWDI